MNHTTQDGQAPNQEKITFKIPLVSGIKRALSNTNSSNEGATEANTINDSTNKGNENAKIIDDNIKGPQNKKLKKGIHLIDINEQLEPAKSYISDRAHNLPLSYENLSSIFAESSVNMLIKVFLANSLLP